MLYTLVNIYILYYYICLVKGLCTGTTAVHMSRVNKFNNLLNKQKYVDDYLWKLFVLISCYCALLAHKYAGND
jgi:hypothetical protein